MDAKIVAVEDRDIGTHLVEQDGDELTVVDADELAGFSQVQVGDEIRAFEASGDVLTLESALVGTYAVDESVYAFPRRVDRVAEVIEPGGSETLEVVIPHDLRDRVDLDTRGEDGERVELERVGTELHVAQLHSQRPRIGGEFVDTMTGEAFSALSTPLALDAVYEPIPLLPTLGEFPDPMDAIPVVAGSDSTCEVDWSCVLRLFNDAGYTVNLTAEATLALDGVPIGISQEIGETGRFDSSGPHPSRTQSAGARVRVPMLAGVTYELSILVRADILIGEVEVVQNKGGGALSYAFERG